LSVRKIKIFRWRAVGPLLLALVVLGVLYWILSDRIAETTTEEASTELLGTQVDVGRLTINERDASVRMENLEVADPFDRNRNLIEAALVTVDIEPVPLLEKKLVVSRISLQNLTFGTARQRPAAAAPPDGFAAKTLETIRSWPLDFQASLQNLLPIDTIRSIILDPSSLATVQEATRLAGQVDSARAAFEAGVRGLDLEPVLDTAASVARRLAGANPLTLGLDGTRRAVSDLKRALDSLGAARRRLEQLEVGATRGVANVERGLGQVDAAIQLDYATARGLLKVPSFSAPHVSRALFGQVSIDRLQQAAYWAELVKRYLPPGLLPRQRPGPFRVRRAGTTFDFPRMKEYPKFLIERGDADFVLGSGETTESQYSIRISDLTSAPAILGRPTRVSAERTARDAGPRRVALDAVIDHTGPKPQDSLQASVTGLRLPGFELGPLPFRVDPGFGNTRLLVRLAGDSILARWTLESDRVEWSRHDQASATPPALEALLWRVLSGVPSLSISAQLTGTIRQPLIEVTSNIGPAIERRLRAVAGEEVAKAEVRVRAMVDSVVALHVTPIQRRVSALKDSVNTRLEAGQNRLDQEKQRLESVLRRLSGGLIGIALPGRGEVVG
jgi:uncharacterized protein (TIGR03545 family)